MCSAKRAHFDHARHPEMMVGIAGVIDSVNAHMDERFDELLQLREVKSRVDKMHVIRARRHRPRGSLAS